MSFDLSAIKSIVLAVVAITVLDLAINAGYGLAFLSWRAAAPLEVWRQLRANAPFLVLGLFLAAVGAILGARLAAGEGIRSRWAGLAAGAGLALLVIVVGWVQGRLDFWLPPNALMAVPGGWLGGRLARRA